MVEKNLTPLARLQNEIIKQKNISLIKPIGDNAFDRLVSLAHDYQRQVSEIIISVINGGMDPHEIPDGEQFQQVFEQLEADPRINRKYLAQIKNFKESQDFLLELALMVAEENQPTSSAPYIEVYQAQGQLDANIMLAFLDANEIEAFSSQESAGVTYGLTIGPLGLAKIFVRANQYREAHQLIQAMINDQIEDKSEDTDPADLPEEPL